MTIVGLVVLVVGVVDPLEGSLLILPAACAVTVAALSAGSRWSRTLSVGLALVAAGFTAMWILTALGGVGGDTGRSAWWALLTLPLVPGWFTVVVGAVLALRESRASAPGPGTTTPRDR